MKQVSSLLRGTALWTVVEKLSRVKARDKPCNVSISSYGKDDYS